jgi:perosamine synthetase
MVIPVSEPNLDLKDAAAVIEAVRNCQVSGNSKIVQEFEAVFANYIGKSFGVSCNSGASALHIALLALGVGEGDEVIVPDLTMIATANAVAYCGAKPVFVDIDEETWCIDPVEVEKKITSKTVGVVPVHLYGHPCDMDYVGTVADAHGLWVLEDSAEAIGSEYRGRKCGSIGDASCFSFYANKNITTGEGGMVVTDDKQMADACRSLRSHAFGNTSNEHFNHTRLGFSYRLSGLQAALGVSQMERIDYLVSRKCYNGKFYNSFLKPLAEEGKLVLPVEESWAKNTYWYYTILVNPSFGMSRDELMLKLLEDGVETRPAFTPMHRQKLYSSNESFPFSEWVSEKGINLPSSSRLKAEEVMYVCERIKGHAK